MSLIAILTALTLGQTSCPQPDAAMLALSLHDFDQTDAGWRSLESAGCEAGIADAIALYRSENSAVLANENTNLLDWHEAQLRASAGQTDAAIAIFEAGLARAHQSIRPYHEATLAFLKQDRVAFDAARARLLTLPEPEDFGRSQARYAASYPKAPPLKWPLNTSIVDGFAACFDRPYREAFICDAHGNVPP